MSEVANPKIRKEFKPSVKFKKLYFVYLVLTILFCILPWLIPVIAFAPFEVVLGISIPVVVIISFVAYWIPKYYNSVEYRFTESEIMWKRGVWFKNTGIVPYNRITNVDVSQGPISRMLGVAVLKVQTAGYSGQTASEIRIEGVEKFEELRDFIMGFVRGKKPVAVEVHEGESVELRILDELVKIRELIEKCLKK